MSHRDLRSGRVLMMGEEIGIIVAAADVATGRVDFVPQEPDGITGPAPSY